MCLTGEYQRRGGLGQRCILTGKTDVTEAKGTFCLLGRGRTEPSPGIPDMLGGFPTGSPEMPPRKHSYFSFTDEEPESVSEGKHLPRCSASKACVQAQLSFFK